MGASLHELQELRQLLQLLARQFDLLLKHCSCTMNINTVECTILYELRIGKQMTLNDLSQKLHVDKSTASRNVQKLVQRGLLQRLPDPNDRRYVQLSLTEQGLELEQEITDTLMQYMGPAFKDLNNERIRQISEDLIKLTN